MKKMRRPSRTDEFLFFIESFIQDDGFCTSTYVTKVPA